MSYHSHQSTDRTNYQVTNRKGGRKEGRKEERKENELREECTGIWQDVVLINYEQNIENIKKVPYVEE